MEEHGMVGLMVIRGSVALLGLLSAGVVCAGQQTFEDGRISVAIGTKADYEAKRYVLEDAIVDFIDGADKTLDIAVQELRYEDGQGPPRIKRAVLKAADRGVDVRVIVEKDYITKEKPVNLRIFEEFEAYENVEIARDGNSDLFHQKFVVRDFGRSTAGLLTGSTNFTNTGVRKNYNHVISIAFDGREDDYFGILERYQAEFDEAWKGTFGDDERNFEPATYKIGQTKVEVLFSPDDDADDRLLEALLDAEQTLDVMVFTFGSNSSLLAGVINRFYAQEYKDRRPTGKPKVSVRVATDGLQSRYWSAIPGLRAIGVPVKLEVDAEAKLHHKVGIIDGETVILGSYNWTRAANDENDENTLVVTNAAIGRMFTDAFDELWNGVLR